MTVEVEAFPLHRFLGPLELKAFVAKGAPQSTIAELRKALVFLAMSHGLNYHPATHGRMVRISAIVDAHFRLIVDGKTWLP